MKKIIITFSAIIFSSFSVFADDFFFSDVSLSHPNFEAITFLKSRGVLNGYENGNFGPDDAITRVQTLKILLLGSKINPVENLVSDFPDVSKIHWGQRFIAEAKNRSIVSGNADGTFRADTTLNLAEGLKMLLKTNDISPAIPSEPPFIDVAVNDWFAPFAAYAKDKNLVDVTENLQPAKQLNRGELAELMYRLVYIRENELDFFQITNEREVEITSVYDGDTFTTSTGEKVRLIGVNTPEKGEEFDSEATAFVESLILNQKVTIKVCEEKRDRYGRTLAEIWTTENKSIAEELLKNGLSEVYIPSTCGKELKEAYEDLELEATISSLGIWSTVGSANNNKETLLTKEDNNPPSSTLGTYECGIRKYCTEMESCEEAMYFLNTCGLEELDRDNDGIPCESLCQ